MSDRPVLLLPAVRREVACNAPTVEYPSGDLHGLAALLERDKTLVEVSFLEHFAALRDLTHSCRGRGLLVAAVDGHDVVASCFLGSSSRGIRCAIVGRHGLADLHLPDDPSVSLRHIAVVVAPTAAKAPVRFRVLDLRTGAGFIDERGERLKGVEADGPLFLYLGRYTVFLFPLDGSPWSHDALDAWAGLPPRSYDSSPAELATWRHARDTRRSWWRRRAHGRDAREDTLVSVLRGPGFARRNLVVQGERPLGEVCIRYRTGSLGIVVGEQAACDGVLIGRYDRCDPRGLAVLDDPELSRVHVLLLHVDGSVWAIDTASTNGVLVNGGEARVHRLRYGDTMTIAGRRIELAWRALGSR